ncbi:hypothetical protein Gpo141_00004254 [Globisporangium polare]
MNSVGPTEFSTRAAAATASDSARARRHALVEDTGVLVVQNQFAYRCLWGLLLFLHAVHTVAYSYEAWEYSNITVISSDFNKILRVFRLGSFFHSQVATWVLISSALVAAVHACSFLRALFWSVKLRRLVFFAKMPVHHRQLSAMSAHEAKRHSRSAAVWRLRYLWMTLFTMDSDHFDAVRDVRKLIEIASQSYSMYVMGKTILSKPMYAYVGISLTLNCWSTPLVQHIWRRQESRRRYFRLLVGVLLGCCFTLISPLVGYVAFKINTRYPQWFDIAWSINALTQLQELMIDKWLEFFASRLNALVVTVGIETLKQRVECATIIAIATSGIKRIPITPSQSGSTAEATETPAVESVVIVGRIRQQRWRFLFLGQGAAILTITIHSLVRSPFIGPHGGSICHVEVQPWFQLHSSCLALEINCKSMGINGSATDIGAELRSVETDQIVALIISDCAQLEMPRELQTLASLNAFEIFNSDIREWNESAAVTSSLQPNFAILRMVLVTGIRELPPGLQAPTFPASDIEFTLTDLASLPTDLHLKWPQLLERLTIEGSHLTQIPDTLLNFEFEWLFLASNWIRQVPPSLFVNHTYSALMLSGNPIQELPVSLGLPDNSGGTNGFSCENLLLQLTGIQEIPTWTKGRVSEVYAGSTPYCLTNRSTSWTNSSATEALKIDCSPFPTPVALSFDVLSLAQKRNPELVQALLEKLSR